MKHQNVAAWLRRVYLITGTIAAIGFVLYFERQGPRSAFGFLLGSMGAFGNLWLFEWLSGAIAPPPTAEPADTNPTQRSHSTIRTGTLFVGRYLGLWLVGYTTVKTLGVGPLPVLFGLLASTLAVLVSSITELVLSFFGDNTAR